MTNAQAIQEADRLTAEGRTLLEQGHVCDALEKALEALALCPKSVDASKLGYEASVQLNTLLSQIRSEVINSPSHMQSPLGQKLRALIEEFEVKPRSG